MIIIPMGSQYHSESQIQLDRKCLCEHCGTNFNYRYKLKGTGVANSFLWLQNEAASQTATTSASEAIRKQLSGAFPPFPCPACGKFQTGMVNYYRKTKLENLFTFTIFCAALFLLISLIWILSTNLMELVHSTVFWKIASVVFGLTALVYSIKRFSKPKQSDVSFQSMSPLATEPNAIVPVPSAEVPSEIQSLIPEFYASRKYGRFALFTAVIPPVSLILVFLSFRNLIKSKSAFRLHPEYCPIPDKSGLTYSIISLCIIVGFSALIIGAFL